MSKVLLPVVTEYTTSLPCQCRVYTLLPMHLPNLWMKI